MKLAFNLARRELRGGLKGFRIFITCLAIGVAAIAGIGTLSESVVAGLAADSQVLLGGDVDLRLQHQPLSETQQRYLKNNSAALARMVEFKAMAEPVTQQTDRRRTLVEMKAVDGLYPMTGVLTLDPPATDLKNMLAYRDGAWGAAVDETIFRKLNLKPGDRVSVGDAVFQLRAAVVVEPDRVATVLSFGPRLLISTDALASTGLIKPGSQVHYHYRVLFPPGTDGEAWGKALNDAFPDAGWRLRGHDNAAPGVQNFIERMTLFLTFVGLSALLVGGIGVSGAIRTYLDGRTATIATLKCLGAPGGLIFRIYLIQVLALSLIGIAAGLAVGWVAPSLGVQALKDVLPFDPRAGVYAGPLLTAAAFGILTAVTFALLPLARARAVPAAALYRDRIAPQGLGRILNKRWRKQIAMLAAVGLGVGLLAALTILTASDKYFAVWFVGGAIATLLALRGGARLMQAAARRARPRNAAWRLVLANIHRPGTQAPGVVLALGLGLSVLVAVALIEGNLARQINERLPDEAPAFFFIDIQPDQVAGFDKAVTAVPGTRDLQRVPTLRGRIVRINGVAVEDVKISHDVSWAVRGDRALTYAAKPAETARITAGNWWPENYAGPPVISLDAGLARGFGIGIGDTLTLNVLGRDIRATIMSLREIDWRSLRFDFAIIFAPGTLEGAPHTHIAALKAERSSEAAVEAALAGPLANISAIRVREALEQAAGMLSGIGLGIRGTALITIFSGALVLAGAIAAGHRRRVYDAVVFKVLGARRRTIFKTFLMEYGVVGLATGVIASAIGTLTAWAVVVFLMRSDWVFLPGVAAITVLICIVLTVFAGFAGTWRALGRKPGPYLRNE